MTGQNLYRVLKQLHKQSRVITSWFTILELPLPYSFPGLAFNAFSNHCPHVEHPFMNHGGPLPPASQAATKAQNLQLIALLPDGRSLADRNDRDSEKQRCLKGRPDLYSLLVGGCPCSELPLTKSWK